MQRILIIILATLNLLAFAGIQGWLGDTSESTEPERIANQLNPERIRLATDTPGQGLRAELPAETGMTQAQVEAPLIPATEQLTASSDTNPISPAADAAPPAMQEDVQPEPVVSAAPKPQPAQAAPQPAAPKVAAPKPAPPPALSCVAWSGLSEANADALSRRLRRSGAEVERSRIETPSAWWVRIPPQGGREQAERQAQELRALGIQDLFIVQEAGPTRYAISLGVFKTENRARNLLNQLRTQGVRNVGIETRTSTTYRIQATLSADTLAGIERSLRGVAAQRTPCTRR